MKTKTMVVATILLTMVLTTTTAAAGADNTNTTQMVVCPSGTNMSVDVSQLKDVTPQPASIWEQVWDATMNGFLGLFYSGPFPAVPRGM